MAWTMGGLKLFGLAFVVSTAYILYGVFGGHLADAVEPRVVENLRMMGRIMAISGVLATICLLVLTHEEIAFSVVAGLVGLGFVLGFPLMVAGQVSQQAANAGDVITSWASITGQGIIVIVGFRILWEIIDFIRQAPARRDQIAVEAGEEKPKALPGRPWYRLNRCWEMPFCHVAIRETCPAYTRRKNCWRIRQGCNCDPYLIESLLKKGAGLDALPEQGSEYVETETQDARKGKGERTTECRRCPIFSEHQRQKFQLLNPILVAASVLALIAAYPIMLRVYQMVISGAAHLAERLAYGTYVPVGEWINRLDSPAVWYFFYIIIGLLALSYVLKAVEWAVLKVKVL